MSGAKPLSREEREALDRWIPTAHDLDVAWIVRLLALLDAAEARSEAERERAERYEKALREIARQDVGGLQSIDEYVFDEKENRYESIRYLLGRVAYRRNVAMAALAADDRHRAAQGEGT